MDEAEVGVGWGRVDELRRKSEPAAVRERAGEPDPETEGAVSEALELL